MSEELQTKETVRDLNTVLQEVRLVVDQLRAANGASEQNIKDLRWKFDQISAKMNQAIYNDQHDQIHSSCLQTVAVLIEILARS
jgi:signal transduction histidine kinase